MWKEPIKARLNGSLSSYETTFPISNFFLQRETFFAENLLHLTWLGFIQHHLT